jgi:hypothetical protein
MAEEKHQAIREDTPKSNPWILEMQSMNPGDKHRMFIQSSSNG